LNWLRRGARRGVPVGGLCTAAYSLAKAGLLNDKKATIHWENQDSFLEEFEDVNLTKSVFVTDGKLFTTAGGTASIDLMLKFIADDHGEELASAVADQLIYTTIRTDQDTQRLSVPTPQSVDLGKRRRHVHPPAGKTVPPLSEPFAQAVLHGTAPAKGAEPFDADRYERH